MKAERRKVLRKEIDEQVREWGRDDICFAPDIVRLTLAEVRALLADSEAIREADELLAYLRARSASVAGNVAKDDDVREEGRVLVERIDRVRQALGQREGAEG